MMAPWLGFVIQYGLCSYEDTDGCCCQLPQSFGGCRDLAGRTGGEYCSYEYHYWHYCDDDYYFYHHHDDDYYILLLLRQDP